MARAEIAKDKRVPFYLYIDEFQNFATDSFATILSEARKYKLSIIVANQYTSQLIPEIRDAIFGNIGTIISFTLGYDDAKVISQQFKELVSTNDLISLPRFTAYTRTMIDGITSDPFSMKSLPLPTPEGSDELMRKAIEQSRQRYAMTRKELEALLEAWARKSFSPQETVALNAQLEGLGFSSEEIEDINSQNIQRLEPLFRDYTLNSEESDAILFDLENNEHKAIWYSMPDNISMETRHQGSQDSLEFYTHTEYNTIPDKPLDVIIGPAIDIANYFTKNNMKAPRWKLVRNVQKIMKNASAQNVTVAMPGTRIGHTEAEPNIAKQQIASAATGFTVEDIVVGQEYEGYVKLLYNYGIFITVKGVEGLLHKNYINDPAPEVTWKKFYNIGDKIKAYAAEIKEIK